VPTNKHLTQESFDRLLVWLDKDRDQAAQKYEHIRRTLIQIFTWRNVAIAEDLADETIDRVASRVDEIAPQYTGDPALYFYGVAKLIMLEEGRSQKLQTPLEAQLPHLAAVEFSEGIDVKDECFSKCLDELPLNARELVLTYYKKEKQRKIDHRKVLAERSGMSLNTLRVRVHRIRADLENCIKKCLGERKIAE
jgi:RNA polymerase sigma factor (sigma-70 family)